MFNRIANAVTFLIFGLLATVLWLSMVAVHDFNTSNGLVFVREAKFIEYFQGRNDGTVGYSVEYTKCGFGLDQIPIQDARFSDGKLEWTEPSYMRIEVAQGGMNTMHHPIPPETVASLPNRSDFVSYKGEIISSWRARTRICKVDFSNLWAATNRWVSKT